MIAANLRPNLVVEARLANGCTDHNRQLTVAEDVAAQTAGGERRIVGLMIESFLAGERRDARSGQPLTYGVSITDACLGWTDTEALLARLAAAAARRRRQ
jgi:3-deoxy-7-phosphoheptulonate synthase